MLTSANIKIIRWKIGGIPKGEDIANIVLAGRDDLFLNVKKIISIKEKKEAQKESAKTQRKENVERGRPANSGRPWSEADNEILKMEFEKSTTINEMAIKLERSNLSIASQLRKLGLINGDEVLSSNENLVNMD